MRYEEEVLRKRTGISRMATLLEKVRELGVLGTIGNYNPDVYEAIEDGELYEFRADIRLHPFHQFVSFVQGVAEAQRDWGIEDQELDRVRVEAENAFYGRDRKKRKLTVFADMEGAEPSYKVAMPVKKEKIQADLEEFAGKATFVAQVQHKVAEGQRIPAARLVRETPMVSLAEQKMMLSIIPALHQGAPGMEDIGFDVAEEDILLRKPAVILKPLCIYRG